MSNPAGIAEALAVVDGREPWAVLEGDAYAFLRALPADCLGAIVTDPPYSSGGAFRGDRTLSTVDKYVQTYSGMREVLKDFGGDNRDQRSFLSWCTLWMGEAERVTRTGGVILSFVDWRQLPILTDAVQAGGWVWRGLATWWKPGVRMQRGRFSASAEYVVYGSKGPVLEGEGSPQNVFRCGPVGSDEKDHIAQKPVEVMRWVLSLTPRDAVIVDPFCGSGATGVAARLEGRRFIGLDRDPRCVELARTNIRNGTIQGSLFVAESD